VDATRIKGRVRFRPDLKVGSERGIWQVRDDVFVIRITSGWHRVNGARRPEHDVAYLAVGYDLEDARRERDAIRDALVRGVQLPDRLVGADVFSVDGELIGRALQDLEGERS
jgi:hypothetical protein